MELLWFNVGGDMHAQLKRSVSGLLIGLTAFTAATLSLARDVCSTMSVCLVFT